MIIFLLILFIGGFFLLAILLASGVLLGQSQAKKQATQMIEKGIGNKSKAKRTLKVLSHCQDNEGKRLYNKLADMV